MLSLYLKVDTPQRRKTMISKCYLVFIFMKNLGEDIQIKNTLQHEVVLNSQYLIDTVECILLCIQNEVFH